MLEKDKFINTTEGRVPSRFEVIDGKCVIPDGVTEILEGEFKNCEDLREIVIPESVTTIGSDAFHSCTALSSITLPPSMEAISRKCFSNCTGLQVVNLPSTLEEIGISAFEGCSELCWIDIPASVSKICESAFCECTKLQCISIPDGVSCIGRSTFYGCTSLTSVRIGCCVEKIGKFAFSHCSALCDVALPDGLKVLENNSFGGCSSLKSINLPEGLKEIGEQAFAGCFALESIRIPEGVEVIGEEAFYVCKNLVSAVISGSATRIELFAFKGCPCEKDITYSIEYKYRPKTKGELISAIRNEIKIQGNKADLNCIDTSAITNMSGLFSKFRTFDGDIRGWNVSNVKDMSFMFDGSNFNGRISRWDVGNVTDMTCMFNRSRFSRNIRIWDVEKVERFFPMFRWCNVREEWKPERFRMGRDENSPVLTGRKKFSDEAEVSFTLTGDGVLTLSGDLKCDLDFDYYRGLGDIPVRKLILEEGITEIGELMFYGWKNLEEVTFPSSLTVIKDRAFGDCRNIRKLNFPKRGLITIGSSVFSSCKVRELHLPETLTSIDSHTFSNCELLEELTLPDSITYIGEWRVFENCSSLRSVKLPAHLKVIPESMFSRCTALEHVRMPEDLERIERYAFLGCSNLKGIELPDTVRYLADDAFESLEFEESGQKFYVANYYANTNRCSFIADDWDGELVIPSSVSHGGKTFVVDGFDLSNCKNLTHVRIPDTVSAISYRAFAGCTALRTVEIPSSVTTVGEEAFRGCTGLKSIELPDSVTEVSDYMFDGCWRLRKVRLGAHTTSIGEYAFQDCEFLQHLHLPDSVQVIGQYAFENCKNLVDIHMSASIERLEIYAFEKTPIMQQEGPIYLGNVLCGFGGSFPKHACLEVREGTTVIAEAAFRGRSNLEAVMFPGTLEHIGYEAFNDCDDLKYVNLPKSLKYLGDGAFHWTKISEVECPWKTPISVEDGPFPRNTVIHVPVGSTDAYKKRVYWEKYEIVEKENCASDPSAFFREDMVVVGRKETYRVILVEKPQHKAPWLLYGVVVSSKQSVDAQRAAKDLLYESFRDTAMFLDWEEDRDMGHCQPLGELIGYKDHRYAVVDLPEDAAPETRTFDGRTYLTDKAEYSQLLGQVTEWNEIKG